MASWERLTSLHGLLGICRHIGRLPQPHTPGEDLLRHLLERIAAQSRGEMLQGLPQDLGLDGVLLGHLQELGVVHALVGTVGGAVQGVPHRESLGESRPA
jgi:hypothetical protein